MIGGAVDRKPAGNIEADMSTNEDKMSLFMFNPINDRMGAAHMPMETDATALTGAQAQAFIKQGLGG